MSIKRIVAAILTFGLSEKMGYANTNDGVIMTDGSELKRAMSDGKVKFTIL